MAKYEVTNEAPYPHPMKSDAVFTSFERKDGKNHFALITIADRADELDASVVIAVLAHECVHAFQFICDLMGETHPSSEFMAYSMQQLLGDVEEAYSETRWQHAKARQEKAARASAKKVRTGNRGSVPGKRRSNPK